MVSRALSLAITLALVAAALSIDFDQSDEIVPEQPEAALAQQESQGNACSFMNGAHKECNRKNNSNCNKLKNKCNTCHGNCNGGNGKWHRQKCNLRKQYCEGWIASLLPCVAGLKS